MEILNNECLCGKLLVSKQFIIQCDICKVWFHGECVAMKEFLSTEVDKFHCPKCQENYGPSLMKIKMNDHRHDYSEKDADRKPVQTGTPVFIKELKSRYFPPSNDIVIYLSGHQLTLSYLETNGFEIPIIINNKDSLNMVVPPPNFSLNEIENYIGSDYEMDVIDVAKQSNIRMKLTEFVEYYNNPYRSRIFNVISLEFSNTRLSPLVEAPYIARKLDWVNYVWPKDWPDHSELKRPEVQKYCLIGVKDSFTDFHIDFGGTSVWYHVLRGEKIFYFIRPTEANLNLYQQWMCSSTQNETFFGDQVDACYKCTLKQGQTMMIPTGWIHAVLTPVDSLVFGGNFIHSINIPLQLRIYEMEKKMKTPIKFQYPAFETINWFAAKILTKELKDLNSKEKKCPSYFLQGLKALLSVLKQWNTEKDYNLISRSQIPTTINSQKLLKDLSKEIRQADKFLMAINPPKPERESKRKRKKPFNKDFLNFQIIGCGEDNSKNDIFKSRSSMKNLLATNDNTLINLYVQNRINKEQENPHFSTSIPVFEKLNTKKNKPIITNNSIVDNIKEVENNQHKIFVNNVQIKSDEVSRFKKPNPTFIRFKLGDSEIVRSTKINKRSINKNLKFNLSTKSYKNLTGQQKTSVYDFHDGSNDSNCEGSTIVKSSKQSRIKKSCNTKQTLSYKLKDSKNMPKNGIEELLKASAYALHSDKKLKDNFPEIKVNSSLTISSGSDRTSQSTRDAVAGMLSFSVQCYSTDAKIASNSSKYLTNNSLEIRGSDDDDDLSIENIEKIHQDDDFIYPALDVSDEDEFILKLKGKKKDDEAWNPKAKLGPLLPKTNRPTRDSAKKPFIEKCLEAAVKNSEKDNINKGLFRNDNKKLFTPVNKLITSTLDETKNNKQNETVEPIILSKNVEYIHSYTTVLTNANRLNDVKAKLAAAVVVDRKPKKRLKTAKQRLGKILKIHKMLP